MDGNTRSAKRARLVQLPFPTRFLAGEDVHYEASLSERQTLFVESDEEGPIYIVPRNDGTQIYIARHLACRHTVRKLSYAEDYLATLAPNRPVRYYCPNQDHEDDFFVVWNKEESTVPLTSTFPFPALRDYALANGSAAALQVERQAAKVNRGFTSSMSMGTRADNGVPIPVLKQGSRDNVIVTSHLVASNIIRNSRLPWLRRTINVDPARLPFPTTISPGNIVDASTYSLSTTCAWHRDLHNPPPPT
jgi:hypothetical protein